MRPPSRIDHIGFAVRSLDQASRFYREVLGLTSAGVEEIPGQKVRVMFFQVGEACVELLEPTAEDSPVARFLERNGPGLHHVSYRVEDLSAALEALRSAGVKLIDQTPRNGAHGMTIAFIHPDSTGGVLTEFCQSER